MTARTFGDVDGCVMDVNASGNICVMDALHEQLFFVYEPEIGRNVDAALRAAVRAYYAGLSDGEEIGRSSLAREFRELLAIDPRDEQY